MQIFIEQGCPTTSNNAIDVMAVVQFHSMADDIQKNFTYK